MADEVEARAAEHTDGVVDEKVRAKPDVAEAVTMNGGSPNVLLLIAPKVMDCDTPRIVKTDDVTVLYTGFDVKPRVNRPIPPVTFMLEKVATPADALAVAEAVTSDAAGQPEASVAVTTVELSFVIVLPAESTILTTGCVPRFVST
jgi:hypothetical protein